MLLSKACYIPQSSDTTAISGNFSLDLWKTDLTHNTFNVGFGEGGGEGGEVVLGVVVDWLVCFFTLMSCYYIFSLLR